MQGRHGLVGITLAVVLAIGGTSGGVLVMRRPAAPPLAAAAPVETSPQTAKAPITPAVGRPSLPEADAIRGTSGAVTSAAVTRAATDRDRSLTEPRITQDPGPGPTMTAARVKAIWRNTDTRSLDRALSALRSATLALHRCDMQITSPDRAVAHCDEVRGGDEDAASRSRRVSWTLDFHRPDDRWLLENVSATNARARQNR